MPAGVRLTKCNSRAIKCWTVLTRICKYLSHLALRYPMSTDMWQSSFWILAKAKFHSAVLPRCASIISSKPNTCSAGRVFVVNNRSHLFTPVLTLPYCTGCLGFSITHFNLSHKPNITGSCCRNAAGKLSEERFSRLPGRRAKSRIALRSRTFGDRGRLECRTLVQKLGDSRPWNPLAGMIECITLSRIKVAQNPKNSSIHSG
jgi:hypothetical protein